MSSGQSWGVKEWGLVVYFTGSLSLCNLHIPQSWSIRLITNWKKSILGWRWSWNCKGKDMEIISTDVKNPYTSLCTIHHSVASHFPCISYCILETFYNFIFQGLILRITSLLCQCFWHFSKWYFTGNCTPPLHIIFSLFHSQFPWQRLEILPFKCGLLHME